MHDAAIDSEPESFEGRRSGSFVRNVAWPPIRHFLGEEGFIVAGFVAFTAMFAIFPFIIFLLSLAGFLGQGEAANESIALALEMMPPEVASQIQPAILDIQRGATPQLMTVSAILAIWLASAGMESIRHALDLAYDVKNSRNFFIKRLQSLFLTLCTATLILVAMFAIVLGPILLDILSLITGEEIPRSAHLTLRYGLGVTLLFAITLLLHLVLPAARPNFLEVLPGAALSVILWVAAALFFSAYLRNFANYNVTYGSLGGVVMTLFFFYLSAIVFIMGAEFNGALIRWRKGRRPRPFTADRRPSSAEEEPAS